MVPHFFPYLKNSVIFPGCGWGYLQVELPWSLNVNIEIINHKWPRRENTIFLIWFISHNYFCLSYHLCVWQTWTQTVCVNSNNQHYCFPGTLPREAPSHQGGDASHSTEGHVCKTGRLTKIVPQKSQKVRSIHRDRMSSHALDLF